MAGRARRVLFVAVLACVPLAALALVEGTASLALFAHTLLRDQVAEDSYTERDTLLGWISKPNFYNPDFYGPGRSLRSNGQRFRHDGDLAPQPPTGRLRVVCSGDSFTLGFGVGDAQTWCAQLAGVDSSLETVNMGQGGYGIDQAYLWYLRDGIRLHPDVHIFAFIEPDFARMRSDRFLGYPKPVLVRDSDGVRAEGVPVPRPGLGRFMVRLTDATRTLRIYTAFGYLYRKFKHPTNPTDALQKDSLTWKLARATFRELARRDSAAGAQLTVVFLPTYDDYAGHFSDSYRRWAREDAARHEFNYVDLIKPLRKTPPDSVDMFFIKQGEVPFAHATGHYTAIGNAWVAAQLRRLVPALTRRLATQRPPAMGTSRERVSVIMARRGRTRSVALLRN